MGAQPPYAPQAQPAAPLGPPDPNGYGAAIMRLAGASRKNAKVAIGIANVLLDEGEIVAVAVAGKVLGHAAVAAYTNKRLLIVNDREWQPLVEEMEIKPDLQVQGWQDDRHASLTFQAGDRTIAVEQIRDRQLAQELAQRLRADTGT